MKKYVKAPIEMGIQAKIINNELWVRVKRLGYEEKDCIYWEPAHILEGILDEWLQTQTEKLLKVRVIWCLYLFNLAVLPLNYFAMTFCLMLCRFPM